MEIERLAETIYQSNTRRRQKIEKPVTPNSDRLEDSSLILVYLFDQRPDKAFYEKLWESRAEIVNSIGRSREIFDAMSSNSVHSNYLLVTSWRCERYFPTNQAVAFIAMPVNISSFGGNIWIWVWEMRKTIFSRWSSIDLYNLLTAKCRGK